jgi:hypothetical protein
MSPPSKDYEVGYKRPPRATRWKKGQSGNPQRRQAVPALSVLETIDGHLLRLIDIVENGVSKKVTVLAAIIVQLWQKEISGDQRALGVRLKYEEIARETAERGVEVEFIGSDYTRALAAGRPPEGDKDG